MQCRRQCNRNLKRNPSWAPGRFWFLKPSELPGTRSVYRLTNRALAQIKELWQYAGEDELPPDSFLQPQVEALRILHIEAALGPKRFQFFCSEHFPGPRRYPRLPRCRSDLGSPLDARPLRR